MLYICYGYIYLSPFVPVQFSIIASIYDQDEEERLPPACRKYYIINICSWAHCSYCKYVLYSSFFLIDTRIHTYINTALYPCTSCLFPFPSCIVNFSPKLKYPPPAYNQVTSLPSVRNSYKTKLATTCRHFSSI